MECALTHELAQAVIAIYSDLNHFNMQVDIFLAGTVTPSKHVSSNATVYMKAS